MWPLLTKLLYRLATVRSLADYEHVRLIVDDRGDAFPQQWVVVDGEHADFRWLVHRSFSIRPARCALVLYLRHPAVNLRRRSDRSLANAT